MDKNFIIYKLTNTKNNKIYVGGTTDPLDDRFHRHVLKALRGSDYPLHKAIREYGEESFEKRILEDCNSLEQLNEREQYWMKEELDYKLQKVELKLAMHIEEKKVKKELQFFNIQMMVISSLNTLV